MKRILKLISFTGLVAAFVLSSCGSKEANKTDGEEYSDASSGATEYVDTLLYENERHLSNVRQLTKGGDNAEAYFSFNGEMIVFQSNFKDWGVDCDQIYYANLDDDMISAKPKMVSTGLGRTTCSYFLPGDSLMVYASTHLGADECPPVPEKNHDRYVWPIFPSFDIFVSNKSGEIVQQLTNENGYDAEATVSPNGDLIVFTSTRSGDLELYTMKLDGSEVKQVTDQLGYDGGAFFSPDGTKLVFRSSRPKTEEAIKKYKDLLAQDMVEPSDMEIYVCNIDGSDLQQVTELGSANWAPFFHPGGEKIIFSSNHANEKGIPFNLFMIGVDGSGLEQITYDGVFDAFPMFSPDGSKLIFSSNRNNGGTRDTNLFLADWKD